MRRFIEKVDRLDEIHKYKMVTSANKIKANKVLNQYKLTEPLFTEVDIWYFEFYWNLFCKYFQNLVPHFEEFRREFYLSTNKLRFLNVIYGEEMWIALRHFDPEHEITNYNEAGKYKYPFPKIENIHSRNKFDQFMEGHMNGSGSLMTVYERQSGDGVKLIAGGMPIEFMYRKMQKLKKPMLWIEFCMALKNYFSDKHAQNLANQIPMVCDIKEFIWTPHARKIRYNSWDSTMELNEMISCVIPQFHDILVVQQSQFLFNNLHRICCESSSEKKRIVVLTGQGVAQHLNQQIYDSPLTMNKMEHMQLKSV